MLDFLNRTVKSAGFFCDADINCICNLNSACNERRKKLKFTLKLDKSREEEVLIYAHEKSALTDKIEKLVLNEKSHVILGYKDDVAT